MGEGAVGPVLDAEAPVVGVVDAHPRLVVLQVVATLRVSGRAVQERAAGNLNRVLNIRVRGSRRLD